MRADALVSQISDQGIFVEVVLKGFPFKARIDSISLGRDTGTRFQVKPPEGFREGSLDKPYETKDHFAADYLGDHPQAGAEEVER